MHHHPRWLVDGNEAIILKEDGKLPLLCRINRILLVQNDLYQITGTDNMIGTYTQAVDEICPSVFQPFDQSRGHGKLLPQDGQELCFSL
jgi:hypothetical protein